MKRLPVPPKVVADARDLPFPDGSFDAATAFYFLMYVSASDRAEILREAYRVLRPDGTLRIWDAVIPAPGPKARKTFVVPVRAELPDRTIRTLYGVRWEGTRCPLTPLLKRRRRLASPLSALNRQVPRSTSHLFGRLCRAHRIGRHIP